MTKFLAIFLSLYTAMHAVFYFRVKALLPERRSFHVLFILFLLLMIVAPIISRLLERNGYESALLKHRPWVSNNSLGRFDLQLSGHTHGGQIYPFNYLVSLQYPLPVGRFMLPKESFLYTNRDSCTWGPQIRLLSPPEVTAIELVSKKRSSG